MEKVNVYDFDKTILPYDSTEAFFRHCLRRYPRVLAPALGALPLAAGMPLGLVSKTRVKEVFYRFLALIPDIDAELTRFWELHLGDINAWYLARRRPDDIVSSASPEFLLRPVAERFGFRLMASRVDKHSGWTLGENNHGEEKVRRFYAAHPGAVTEAFYSDSLSDTPMARIAQRAYLIIDKGQTPVPWPEEK